MSAEDDRCDDRCDDLWTITHELRDGERLGLAELVRPRVARKLGPAVGEVAVEIDPARSVLAVDAVAVAVRALDEDLMRGDLALVAVRGAHDARVGRVDDMRGGAARRRDAADRGDEAVAVDVAGAVFVGNAVAVVVDDARVRAARMLGRERRCTGVGVRERDRDDVDFVEKLRRVARDSEQRLEHALRRRELLAVHAADEEERGALHGAISVAERDHMKRPTFA